MQRGGQTWTEWYPRLQGNEINTKFQKFWALTKCALFDNQEGDYKKKRNMKSLSYCAFFQWR